MKAQQHSAYGTDFSSTASSTTQSGIGLRLSDNRKTIINQHSIQLAESKNAAKKLTSTQLKTISSNSRQPVLQARLMPLDIFKSSKKSATNAKKVKIPLLNKEIDIKNRSTKDYESLYNEYHKQFSLGYFSAASKILHQISEKVDKMGEKKYWKSENDRDDFVRRLRKGIEEEKSHLYEHLFEQNSSDARFHDRNSSYTGDEAMSKYWARYNRFYLVKEIVKKLMSEGSIPSDFIYSDKFFNELDSIIPLTNDPSLRFPHSTQSYTDLYNSVAAMFGASMKTQDGLISDIINNNILSDGDKLAEVCKTMMGNFTWYVNSVNIATRDAAQLDSFILWGGGGGVEPSGKDKMNCWEGAIFSLYKSGLVAQNDIAALYQGLDITNVNKVGVNHSFSLLNKSGSIKEKFLYDGKFTSQEPQPGDIVYTWENLVDEHPQHVVIALGNNSFGSLWNDGTNGSTGVIKGYDHLLRNGIQYITYASNPWSKVSRQ